MMDIEGGIVYKVLNVHKNPYDIVDWLNITNEDVVKFLNINKEQDHFQYFQLYVRYIKKIEVSYPKDSLEWKLFLSLIDWIYSTWFINCEISNDEDNIKANLSFIDYVKLLLIISLKRDYWLSDKLLQSVFRSLRYDIQFKPSAQNGKISDDASRFFKDLTLLKFTDYERFNSILSSPTKEAEGYWEEMSSKWGYIIAECNESIEFEEALYYSLVYKKSVFFWLGMPFKLLNRYYFLNWSDIWFFSGWICVNLLRLLLPIEEIQGEENPARWILNEERMIYTTNMILAKKGEYINKLEKELKKMSNEIGKESELLYKLNTEEYIRLLEKITKSKIELHFSYFDMDNKEEQQADWKNDIDNFLKYKANGEYTIHISHWEVRWAKNEFSTNDLSKEKYEQLKAYVGWYWHVSPDMNWGITTRYVWQKRHNYWKDKSEI